MVSNIGGQGSEYWGEGRGQGGAKLFAGCKLIGTPPPPPTHTHTHTPNQPQIITSLTLKNDNIAKLSGEELKRILLEISSNKIKGTYVNWYICDPVFTVSHRH